MRRAILDGDADTVRKTFDCLMEDNGTRPVNREELERTVIAENSYGMTALRACSSTEAIEAYMHGIRALVDRGALSPEAPLRILSHVHKEAPLLEQMTPVCEMAGLLGNRAAFSKMVDEIERFGRDGLLSSKDIRALLCEESPGNRRTALYRAVEQCNHVSLKRLLDCCMEAVRHDAMDAKAILTGLGFGRPGFAEWQTNEASSGHPLYIPFYNNHHETMQVVLDAFDELRKMGKLTEAEVVNHLQPLLGEDAPRSWSCRRLLEAFLSA